MLMDATNFKLSRDDIIREAIMRCKREMYARAQPSVDYDKLVEKYRGVNEKIYERYYLSREESKYVIDKYIRIYGLEDKFKENLDLIIDNMQNGTITDNYIPEKYDADGHKIPGYRDYKDVPPLKDIIGESIACSVIDYIKDRRNFYKTDHESEQFQFAILMGDSPTQNPKSVIEYWSKKGINIKIDPRHYNNDYFWDEENGYLEDDDE